MAWQTTQPSLLVRMKNPADHAAWAEFDSRYGELIVRYCRSRGMQQSDAEDVRQVVLMNLSRTFPRFEYSPARGRFRSYLGRVVRNSMSRAATRPERSDRALDSGVLATASLATMEATDEHWEREWIRHHMRRGMQAVRRSFNPRSVEAFDRLLAGASVDEVARELDMTTQAVHKAKQRIRDRLKSVIAEQVAEEDGLG